MRGSAVTISSRSGHSCDSLTQLRVGKSDRDGFRYGRMFLNHSLEFADRNLQAAAVDYILQPINIMIKACVFAFTCDFE